MEHTIWTEKYRPSKFEDVKGQKGIVEKVKAFVENKNMPHLLFAGPPGVGKSTLALVAAKSLYKETWHENFLELNASDERGIDIIRTKVKNFARTKSLGDVPFKIIFLDECDALTREAQQALRRTMENFTSTCRFIASCNYSSKIIDPIQSRCIIFRFKPLDHKELKEIIEGIAKTEGLKVDEKAKDALISLSEGDCRKMENMLQGSAASSKTITEEIVYGLASAAKPSEIKNIMELAIKNKFLDSRKLLLETMLNHGLSGLDMIKFMQKEILNLSITDIQKAKLIASCGEAEFRISEGSDEYIQLEAFLAKAVLLGSK